MRLSGEFVEVGDINGVPVRVPKIVREPVDAVTERIERQRVCSIAHSFVGTPYHHYGVSKAGGVDCATLLQMVTQQAKIIPANIKLPSYAAQWHLHRHDEKLLRIIGALAVEKPWPPKPGDVIIWKIFNTFCHGSFAINPPKMIHAELATKKVCIHDYETPSSLTVISERVEGQGNPRPRKVFTFWPETAR